MVIDLFLKNNLWGFDRKYRRFSNIKKTVRKCFVYFQSTNSLLLVLFKTTKKMIPHRRFSWGNLKKTLNFRQYFAVSTNNTVCKMKTWFCLYFSVNVWLSHCYCNGYYAKVLMNYLFVLQIYPCHALKINMTDYLILITVNGNPWFKAQSN